MELSIYSVFVVFRYFVKDLDNKKFKQHKLETIAKMEKYLASVGCRRKLVNEKRERERCV